MPTYTILGATGNCGQALLELLLKTPNAQIKVYCRNKDKLYRLVPEVINSNKVEIFTGSISDVDLLAKAMHGSQAVFLTATTNDNIPGCHISQDLARTVIAGLEKLRSDAKEGEKVKMPRLAILSSATLDPWLSRKTPWMNAVLIRSAWHVYHDLELAEAYLRQHEDWVQCVYIKPGGLSVDVQRGHRLTLDAEESFVSYLDIAAGMIEAADDAGGKWDRKNVAIVNSNGKAKFPPGTPRCIVLGLLRYYFPFIHGYLPGNTGPA
jgi:hypothetical protein